MSLGMLRRGADGFKKLANSMDAAENFDDQTMAKKHVLVIQRGIFRRNFSPLARFTSPEILNSTGPPIISLNP
jgi:hypothetical protein